MLGSRPAPLHPELAIWCPALAPHCSKTRGGIAGSEGRREERKEEDEGRKEGRRRRKGGGGVAPLLKSRDPHLAGGEKKT